jgi:hypothetical protein
MQPTRAATTLRWSHTARGGIESARRCDPHRPWRDQNRKESPFLAQEDLTRTSGPQSRGADPAPRRAGQRVAARIRRIRRHIHAYDLRARRRHAVYVDPD